jgi:hypothetical protein
MADTKLACGIVAWAVIRSSRHDTAANKEDPQDRLAIAVAVCSLCVPLAKSLVVYRRSLCLRKQRTLIPSHIQPRVGDLPPVK